MPGLQVHFQAEKCLIALGLAAEQFQFFDIDPKMCKSIFLQRVRRGLGLALHDGPSSCLTAAGTSFSTQTNRVPRRRMRPTQTRRRHTPFNTTTTPLAARVRPLEGEVSSVFCATC